MKKLRYCVPLAVLACACLLTGCGANEGGLDPKKPVTVTFWHNYGGQMQNTMNELVDEFNNTVGQEKGIILNVTSVSSLATLQEKLLMAASGDPGAPELPDIIICYPKTALLLRQKGLVLDLQTQFGQEELNAYLPRFIEEGRLYDGGFYVFPIAKSTEVLFVNQTLFDRFSSATGVSSDSLSTFKGIAEAAVKYYEWTDSLTPDEPNDGKAFYASDSWFNLAQVGMEQLGDHLIEDEHLDLYSENFKIIWDCMYDSAVNGGLAVFDGYSSDLSKTGDIVCSLGSTAGILFYGSSITYPDNTTEDVEYTVLPYPTFETGNKIAIQRGGGVSIIRSTPQKEYAASVFLKWFTAPEQNMKFISSTGYLPVTNQAFGDIMEQEMETVSNENIKKLLAAAITMHRNYDFYIPPTFDEFDALGKEYESGFKKLATHSREVYLNLIDDVGPDAAFSQATDGQMERFISKF